MAITADIEVVSHQMWPQGDIRDPLGVWGFRRAVVGDATGGSIKVTAFVPPTLSQAFVYTIYSAIFVVVDVVPLTVQAVKLRLLTNWPDIDPQAGIQAYSTFISSSISGDTQFTAPISGPNIHLVGPNDRFIPLFDPRTREANMNLLEIEFGENVLNTNYSAEGYGYYWDRSVMDAPGGLRHPGSS